MESASKVVPGKPGRRSSAFDRRVSKAGSELDLGDSAEAEDANIPVLDSDLRLEEETEDPFAVTNESLSAIEQLSVRTFKILQLLRSISTEKNIEGSMDDQHIVTVRIWCQFLAL